MRSTGDLMVLLAAGGSLAVGALGLARYLLSPRARRRRLLRRARAVSLDEARDGALVKLVGVARREADVDPLIAPLSQRPCLAYELKIENSQGVGEHAAWQVLLVERATHERFWLEQDGERAGVELAAAQLALEPDTEHSGLSFVVPDAVLTLLESRNVGPIDATAGLRYAEEVLEEGGKVAVLGRCVREPDPHPPDGRVVGYRERPTRVRIVAGSDPVLISDAPALLR
jgi:hypothetical protein